MSTALYVSGAGMAASRVTWAFKVKVIQILLRSGVGVDTKFHYYRRQFPNLDAEALARRVCDPIEGYDLDWPGYRGSVSNLESEDDVLTRFVAQRDDECRRAAAAAIYCYDEAGFGSGVNSMRFIEAGKPILGFLHQTPNRKRINVQNILQLGLDYPKLTTLVRYRDLDDIEPSLMHWIRTVAPAADSASRKT